jgi:hypothetical protein
MILFDLFINRRRVDLREILLIFILGSAIVISFLGDKIFGDEEKRLNEENSYISRKPNNKKNKKLSYR